MTRVLIFAAILVVMLALAVPAMGFNGYRSNYTLTASCQMCHTVSPGTPIYNEWVETKHAEAGADGQGTRAPTGSSCAGCHTANYDPGKASPSPSGTTFAYANNPDTFNILSGDNPSSELFVGCSSCHYGASSNVQLGSDTNNTAHSSDMADMANADICGQCHSRYSYTAQTYDIILPSPGASPTKVQPQYAIGFHTLGDPPSFTPPALSTNLIVQQPGWTPTPDPAATTAAGLMMYWKDPATGNDMLWQRLGHDGSAAQYPEWLSEGHADSLTDLIASGHAQQSCLKCHSADYRNAPADDKPTLAEAKYGVTCVGCHTPHDKGTVTGQWDEEFDAQLIGDSINMCTDCHNGELTDGKAAPGATVHHPMKEVMDGTAGIDVPGMPSTHKNKCVKCHMPPTSYSRGAVQLGGNHTFTIIEPEVANGASPMPIATTTARATSTPTPGTVRVTTTLTVTQDTMPYSACSTCHNNNVVATPQPVSTTTATPTPAPAPTEAVTVTVTQNAAGGDKGEYLQDTIIQRQADTHAAIAAADAALASAATRLGYGSASAANSALNTKGSANWNADELAFQKAWTNKTIVDSEGSYGVHNFAYTTAIINKAIDQAKSVRKALGAISISNGGTAPTYTPNPAVVYGDAITFFGSVVGGDQAGLVGGMVKLWQLPNGSSTWNVVASTYVEGDASDQWSITYVPKKNAIYKAQFVGTDSYGPVVSTTVGADVKWYVSFKASKTSVKKNTKITYSGTVTPASMAGAYAGVTKVDIQRKVSGNWKAWKTIAIKADGTYSAAIKMTAKGKFVLRGFFKGDTNGATPPVYFHLDGKSGSKTITVK